MITICWIQHASEGSLVTPVVHALEKLGLRVILVCKTKAAHDAYREAGIHSHFVGHLLSAGEEYSQEVLREQDLRYGPPGFSEILGSDVQMNRLLSKTPVSAYQAIARMYAFWEDFFSAHKIEYVVARESATFVTRTAYNVARYRGLPFAQMVIGPGQGYFNLDDVEEEHVWTELLTKLQNGPRDLTLDEETLVREFVSQYTFATKESMPLRYVPTSFWKIFRELLGLWLRDTDVLRRDEPVLVGSYRYKRHVLWKRIVWRWITQPLFSYDVAQRGESYVYFPFYSGMETSYLSRNHYWATNELSLIEEVAHSLPVGFKLYVKEHPVNPGDFTYWELRRLQRHPNIRVLHPLVTSQELIKESSAVVVLQGTVGWEAFLNKVPVVCLGRPFFSHSRLVFALRDISEVSRVLWRAIKEGPKVYSDRRAEWLWFIHAVISTSGEGDSVLLMPPYGFPDDVHNAQKIANHLYAKISREVTRTSS